MSDQFIWHNGAIVDAVSVPLPQDRTHSGFWLGDGLFETFLAENGEIFAKDRHLKRLLAASNTMDLHPNLDRIEVGLSMALSWLGNRSGQVRLSYLSSDDVIVTAREHESPSQPLSLIEFPHPRSDSSLLNGIKSLSYGESAVALRYARSRGCDDVITSNSKGEVVETALANILFWDGSTWLTPTRSSGCLPGVTRELLIEYFSIQESDISVKEIQEMRSLATTSSLRDVQGVSSFQDISGNRFSFEQEPVDRLRQSFKEWRRKNPHP